MPPCTHERTPTPQARLTGVSKLDDANEAGGRNGYKCTLIITEGDSAKALAISGERDNAEMRRRDPPPRDRREIPPRSSPRSPPPPRATGLSVIGRDYYGVFPLRGKLLNVRDANHSTIMANKEISELKQILGLQQVIFAEINARDTRESAGLTTSDAPRAGQGLHRPRRAPLAALRPPDDHDRPGPRRLAHQGPRD